MNRIIFGGMFFLLSLGQLSAQSVFGKWQTIDDRTGKPKGVVEIYERGGRVYGKITKILERGRENAVCIKCEGDLKDKPIVGMEIITDFEEDNGKYRGKRLFDPEQAMTFRGKIWLDPDDSNRLKVRGYLAFLYRTQTWLRVTD